MIYRRETSRGFTLIELLVVIAIISVLARITFISLAVAKAKARDAWRMASLIQLQTALMLYYEKYGSYPEVNNGHHRTALYCQYLNTSGSGVNGDGYIPGLVPEFMPVLPLDPHTKTDAYDKCGFVYMARGADGELPQHYKIQLLYTPESEATPKFYDVMNFDVNDHTWMITDKYELPTEADVNFDPLGGYSLSAICSEINDFYYNGTPDERRIASNWPACWI